MLLLYIVQWPRGEVVPQCIFDCTGGTQKGWWKREQPLWTFVLCYLSLTSTILDSVVTGGCWWKNRDKHRFSDTPTWHWQPFTELETRIFSFMPHVVSWNHGTSINAIGHNLEGWIFLTTRLDRTVTPQNICPSRFLKAIPNPPPNLNLNLKRTLDVLPYNPSHHWPWWLTWASLLIFLLYMQDINPRRCPNRLQIQFQ